MARKLVKPTLQFRLVLIADNPSVGWNCSIVRGKKVVQRLSDGHTSYDPDIVKMALVWEELGATVIASRYNYGGTWTEKPWRWFNRFKRLLND